MKIGELAQRVGCSVPAIRLYEEQGLLHPATRTAGNYRAFDGAHMNRLLFVLRCRSLEMSHEEIRRLLTLQDAAEASCDEVNALLDTHLRWVEQRLLELTALRRQLQDIRSSCAGGVPMGDCRALSSLRAAHCDGRTGSPECSAYADEERP